MKSIAALFILLLPGCSTYSGFDLMDQYCYQRCKHYHAEVSHAEWQGNDERLQVTRCACYIGKDDYQVCYLVPYKKYKHP